MGLYEKLKQRKAGGEQLNMKQVTYEVLQRLWWQEECTDSEIAALYDVPRKKVTNLRDKWGIKPVNIMVRAFEQRFPEDIPLSEQTAPVREETQEAVFLLRKVNELNDLELESLRLELSRRYAVFAEAKRETDFLTAVEKVIREFWAAE